MKRALALATALCSTALCSTALFLCGCRGQPSEALTWREAWELLVLTRDGGLVDARIAVGNTGLLKAQGHLRAERWAEEELPIIYGRDVAPIEVAVNAERTAVRLGLDGLALGEEAGHPEIWTFRARDAEARVLLHLDPEDPAPPAPQAWIEGGGQWTLSAPVPRGKVTGWVSAAERGGLIEGWGALLHRGGDGRPAGKRTTVLLSGRDLGLGLDTHGQGSLAWAWLDGEQPTLGRPTLDLPPTGRGSLRFEGGPEVELRLGQGVEGSRLLHEHLLGPERWLASALGQWKERRVRRGWARVRWQGRELLGGVVVVEVDEVPLEAAVARPELAAPGSGDEALPTPP